jgi:hypothetical protein
MLWSAFNALGDLPVGVYRATRAEVVAHLGHGTMQRVAMYLSKSNFIFPRSTLTSSQERTMKKHMLKYISPRV